MTTISYSNDARHDFHASEKELAGLLDYIANVSFHRVMLDAHTPGTASLEEYVDRGIDALLYAWEHWDAGRGVPFYAMARHAIWKRMQRVNIGYHVWTLPGGRSVPDADMIGRVVAQDTDADGTGGTLERLCEPPETLAWFYRDMARHWACMSPTMQQALQDALADRDRQEISRRDGVNIQEPCRRLNTLVAFLKRHVYDRETSCMEEQIARKMGTGEKWADPGEAKARHRAKTAAWRQANKERMQAWEKAYRQRSRQLAMAD